MALVIIGLLLWWIYMTPALVAFVRPHPSRAGILVINLFLGWTLLGWVGALAWAVTGQPDR